MKIIYEFLTGEKIEVETTQEIGQAILQMEEEMKNNDERETSQHKSLSEIEVESEIFIDTSVNVE